MTLIHPTGPPAPLATCSVKAYRNEMGVPVRTTVGMIRAFKTVNASGLAPYGLLKVEDPTEFRTRYLARLDANADKIDTQLAAIADEHPDQVLVLLCFEALGQPGAWCHRTSAAEWLGERYGIDVPELSGGC